MTNRDRLKQIKALYDRFSAILLACAGDTFQAGLVRLPASEDPRASNLYFATQAGIRSGHRILDAGCGVCGPSIHIAEHYSEVRIDAVTISPVQVQMGRERVSAVGLSDRITVHEADFHELPFEENTFDVVLFFECTGYSYDPLLLFKEVYRVLRPGGTVYIKDVFQRHEPQSPDERREQLEFDHLWALHESPTLPGTVETLRRAGFEEVREQIITNIGSAHFIGSMFGREEGGNFFALNSFGQHFYRSMPHLPNYFGEVAARKPA